MSESPRRFFVLLIVLLCSACASTGPTGEHNNDPFEPTNRAIFKFNDGLDKVILKPVAKGYKFITPAFVRRGVGNFFANLYDINGALNAVLQGRFPEAARNTARFLVNTTAGLLGFVDVATKMELDPYRTDFGHTLTIWGADSGPYLMVPFFGPRTVRSGTGSIFDSVASLQWQLDTTSRNLLFLLEVVDARAAVIDAEELITGDRYIFIRDAYLQQREYFVKEGAVIDSFSDDVDEEFDWE
jgi:phospholipid-binding lipoprotein MlaA